MKVYSIDNPTAPPLEMPDKFRTEVAYFMTPKDHPDAPPLKAGEYFIRQADVAQWLEDFMVTVISPLDATNSAQFELTDDQEKWLEWMQQHKVEIVRVE